MKKLLLFALVALSLSACTTKTTNGTQSADADRQPSVITWIEDKPGPTVQGRNVFPSVPDSLWSALGLTEGVPSSISCFLLETEGCKILLDAGLGAPFSQLIPKLEESGVTPDSLSLIYITHMHPDHIGGMLHEGSVVFPNAEVYVNRVEAEAWQSMDGERAALPKAVLNAYSDHLHLFEAGDMLPGGVLSIAAYGHTPGHTVFQKDSILVIADLMHGAALQMSHPEYCPFFDMDPAAATEARIRIMDYARSNSLSVYGMHLPTGSVTLSDAQ
ncbi:MAG: MBL fold metallo-hydrolase [Bacteroidales bacterium]|nr:MBL fold metallo-hydrolase [Candidatus Liminaster caballi]